MAMRALLHSFVIAALSGVASGVDLTDEYGDWEMIINFQNSQYTAPPYALFDSTTEDTLMENENDKSAMVFMKVGAITDWSQYRGSDGKITFKVIWNRLKNVEGTFDAVFKQDTPPTEFVGNIQGFEEVYVHERFTLNQRMGTQGGSCVIVMGGIGWWQCLAPMTTWDIGSPGPTIDGVQVIAFSATTYVLIPPTTTSTTTSTSTATVTTITNTVTTMTNTTTTTTNTSTTATSTTSTTSTGTTTLTSTSVTTTSISTTTVTTFTLTDTSTATTLTSTMTTLTRTATETTLTSTSTTAMSTTAKSTTAKNTTAKNTTAKNTTAKNTTAKSTTAKSTTAQSTTAKSTTAKSTTAKSTTLTTSKTTSTLATSHKTSGNKTTTSKTPTAPTPMPSPTSTLSPASTPRPTLAPTPIAAATLATRIKLSMRVAGISYAALQRKTALKQKVRTATKKAIVEAFNSLWPQGPAISMADVLVAIRKATESTRRLSATRRLASAPRSLAESGEVIADAVITFPTPLPQSTVDKAVKSGASRVAGEVAEKIAEVPDIESVMKPGARISATLSAVVSAVQRAEDPAPSAAPSPKAEDLAPSPAPSQESSTTARAAAVGRNGLPCGDRAAGVCTGNATELCRYDESCSRMPPWRGGLGCNAGGVGQNCRFCGFKFFLPCDFDPSDMSLPCKAEPAAVCAGPKEPCYLDRQCTELPPALQGLGCNAGGAGQDCRFCGFGIFAPCPLLIVT